MSLLIDYDPSERLTVNQSVWVGKDQSPKTILRIHPKTLQRLARHGRVTGYRIGKLWRFHASDLEGSTAALAGALDSGASRRYALSTSRARN
jgi:excisionase family DNA binding protein